MPIQSEDEIRELISSVERETSNVAYRLAMLRQDGLSYREVKTAFDESMQSVETDPLFHGEAQRYWLGSAIETAYNVPVRWTKKGKEKEAASIAMQVKALIGLDLAEKYGIERYSEELHELNRILQDKHGSQ